MSQSTQQKDSSNTEQVADSDKFKSEQQQNTDTEQENDSSDNKRQSTNDAGC